MNTIDVDGLAQIIRQVDGNHDLGAGALDEAILDRLPAPQIIRTVAELEALDPETVVWPARHYGPYTVGTIVLDPFNTEWTPPLPAVVVATGPQVRAARKALDGSDAAR